MPQGGVRTPLSYSWGQSGLAQFAPVFQPGHGIFSPGFPLAPPEPEETRVWDFPVGVNTIFTPRSYEPVSFAELRALADGHDITRLAIETRKDQIERLDWVVRPRNDTRVGNRADPRITRLTEFFRRPDGIRPFATWLRELLEDVLVLDAPALELRRNRAGEVIGLDVIDGSTIKLLFDDTGRRPLPPAPGFEQVIHGRPWKLLTGDELIYLPRNPRPHRAYGFGPVEQIVMTINIGLRRQAAQLQHFTEGNVPPGLLTAPDGWSGEQIAQFQEWFDSVLAGNTAARSRLVWAPAGAKYQPFKEAPYKDEFDEWLARIVCYAFSLPATAFTRQVNRATAETTQEAAVAEGLAPLMGWVKRLADHVIQDRFFCHDLEFAWVDLRPEDPDRQSKILDLYVRSGIYAVNEARQVLGLAPVPGGDAPMVYGSSGPVPLGTASASPLSPSPAPRERVAAGESPRTGEGAVASVAKAYNPDEPRVPAGNPDGGQWTSDGDGNGGSEGSGGHAPEVGVGGSGPPRPDGLRIWERYPNPDFRNKLAVAEGSADKADFGYREIHHGPKGQVALGRYQMTPAGLQAAGMIDAHGHWTGKYGVNSADQFLGNPDAQESALTDLLKETERQLRANGAFKYIGAQIDGQVAPFTVTEGGLLAAAHREGALNTREYLNSAASNGFVTRNHDLSPEFARVETRLRTFADAPYK